MTFCAGGIVLVSPQNVSGGGVARPRGQDRELPQRVAVGRRARRPVHPDVAPRPGHRQVLHTAGPGGRRVDRRPRGPVVRRLDLVRLAVRGLPVQRHAADRLRRPQVHLEPLRVGEPPRTSASRCSRRRRPRPACPRSPPRRPWPVLFSAALLVQDPPPEEPRAVDGELPQRVAVGGVARGPVHPDVPAGAGDVQRLGPAGAGGGRVDRSSTWSRRRRLDLVRLARRGLPVQHHLADGLGAAQVHLEPLRVRERRGPAGPGVPVHGGRGRRARRSPPTRRWRSCSAPGWSCRTWPHGPAVPAPALKLRTPASKAKISDQREIWPPRSRPPPDMHGSPPMWRDRRGWRSGVDAELVERVAVGGSALRCRTSARSGRSRRRRRSSTPPAPVVVQWTVVQLVPSLEIWIW